MNVCDQHYKELYFNALTTFQSFSNGSNFDEIGLRGSICRFKREFMHKFDDEYTFWLRLFFVGSNSDQDGMRRDLEKFLSYVEGKLNECG